MLLDLLFPRRCLGCGLPGAYFCSQCLNQVYLQNERFCPMCNQPSLGGLTHPGCQRPWGLDGLTAIFRYQGILKKAIGKLKNRFVTDLAADLVELFLSFCGEDEFFCRLVPQAVLVPVPLEPSRQRWRGFNQAALLGQMIAQRLQIKFAADLLIKKRAAKPQKGLAKKTPQGNSGYLYRLNPNLPLPVQKTCFFLFDDFWTSGATLRQAGQVLKRHGATKVWGLTLAR